ncbi:hypothetical protein BJ508DRAFT_419000 [Ascobolus immersus RN42]|uniref:lytic cellulose monooxygenase (C4-dehydrogenating) n=1 Tax=Ascobolus immersus RN42 TaxID=1160509 RepID=A0A3N4HKU4_ASCIM|nr:hypothetical protein BJ508DRAFT_419000 [Ascobolus immersus RN42]
MKFTATAAFALLGFATQAFAHYRFTTLHVDGKAAGEFQYIRKWTPIYNNGPVEDVTLESIRCNVNPTPADETLKVAAGTQIGFSADQAIIHPGPYMAYMAKAPAGTDISRWDGNGDWFKIFELGTTSIDASGLSWDMSSGPWNFVIPKDTPSGQYLLRFEHIGLHGAGTRNGAQHYMTCAQIEVTNGGNGTPGPTIKFPGGYKQDDAGILINIYFPVPTSYTIPGPPVWSGSSGSPAPQPTTTVQPPVTTAPPTTLTTSVRPTTTSTTPVPTSTTTSVPAPTQTPDDGATAGEWDQCGGASYSGPTKCAAGLTCVEYNPYYSQCIKA